VNGIASGEGCECGECDGDERTAAAVFYALAIPSDFDFGAAICRDLCSSRGVVALTFRLVALFRGETRTRN
jgi:hypothetical protein